LAKKVLLSKVAQKDLAQIPSHIGNKLMAWIELVEQEGLGSARKIKGFHDEPLKGKRQHQRSIRLSRSYRAIYSIMESTEAFIYILEINKHDY
jgi:proteic killer suppression protein